MKSGFVVLTFVLASALAFGADRPANNFILEAKLKGLARIEVRITAADVKSPLTYSSKAKDGAIADWIYVPPGADRSIEIVLFDAKGEALARGRAAENVSTEIGSTILVPALMTKTGETVGVSLSTHRVVITQLDKRPGKEGKVRFQAQIFDAKGNEVPIKPGTARWADVNQPGMDPGFDPRDPRTAYLQPDPREKSRPQLNPCLCIVGQPCRCLLARDPQPVRYIAVTAGRRHSCAIDQFNKAFCWGGNASGELGAATPICMVPWVPVPLAVPCSTTPVAVQGGHLFTSISAGGDHTCALDQAQNAWCWGWNGNGQLGIGGATAPTAGGATPAQVAGTTKFKSISSGQFHTCALGTDDLVYCWGKTNCGQAGPSPAPLVPRAISKQTFKALSAGAEHNCAIGTNDSVMCWGRGDSGQIGFTGNLSPFSCGNSSNVPGVAVFAPAVTPPAVIAAGGSNSCVGSSKTFNFIDGAITCWGGALRSGAQQYFALVKRLSLGGDNISSDHACSVSSTGTAHCWGMNSGGLLGVGSTQLEVAAPAYVITPPTTYLDIDSGTNHTCGISAQSEVYCWGSNPWGQLGDGTQTDRTVPVKTLLLYFPPIKIALPKP